MGKLLEKTFNGGTTTIYKRGKIVRRNNGKNGIKTRRSKLEHKANKEKLSSRP